MKPTRDWTRTLRITLAIVLALTGCPWPEVAWASRTQTPPERGEPAALDLDQLDLATLAVPEALGYVLETWQPPDRPPRGLVIHLQDLHTHPEAQEHLSQLIGYLHETLGVELVALEGAEGLCDTTLYSDFPDPPSTQRIARLFMEEGLFTGAEYYAITNPGKVTLWGVEEEKLYLEHLTTYQQGARHQAEAEVILGRLRDSLEPLRRTLYPQALQHLLELKEAYERSDDNTFQPYLEELQRMANAAKLDLASYPDLQTAVQLHTLYDQLDMHLVEAEQRQLLEALVPRLRLAQRQRLEALAKALATQQISPASYYDTLAELAKTHGLLLESPAPQAPQRSPTDYPNLRNYLQYLRLSRQLSSGHLTEELAALEEAIEDALLTTSQQRTLSRLLDDVTLLNDLIHVKLSPKGWRDYHASREQRSTDALNHSITQLLNHPLAPTDLARLVESLPTLERFYELATKRDDAFLRNTLAKLDDQPTKTAILIAGGFHTPGLTSRFKEQGIAYAVITPKIDGEFDESRYQARLQNEMPSIGELMRKLDTLALIQWPATFESSNAPMVEQNINPQPEGVPRQPEDILVLKKPHATKLIFLINKARELIKQYGHHGIEMLRDFFQRRPKLAAIFGGVTLAVAVSTVVLYAMGAEFTFDTATMKLVSANVVGAVTTGAMLAAVAGGGAGTGEAEPPPEPTATGIPEPGPISLAASRAILERIATDGILSPREQLQRYQNVLQSTDGGAGEPSNRIAVNVVFRSWSGLRERDAQAAARDSLYDHAKGALQVVMERATDGTSALLDKPDTELQRMLEERARASVIAILDVDKFDPFDQGTVAGQTSIKRDPSQAYELAMIKPIPSQAIRALLVPRALKPLAAELFLSATIIEVDEVTRPLTIARRVPYRGWQERSLELSLPNYEAALAQYFAEHAEERVVFHGVRLVAPLDISPAAPTSPSEGLGPAITGGVDLGPDGKPLAVGRGKEPESPEPAPPAAGELAGEGQVEPVPISHTRLPRGEFWDAVAVTSDAYGRTFTAKPVLQRIYHRGPGESHPEITMLQLRLYPEWWARLGFSLNADGTVAIPDTNGLNARLEALDKSNEVPVRFYDAPGVIDGKKYTQQFMERGELPLGTDDATFFHDRFVHLLGFTLLPPEVVRVMRAALRLQAGLSQYIPREMQRQKDYYLGDFDNGIENFVQAMEDRSQNIASDVSRRWDDEGTRRKLSEEIEKLMSLSGVGHAMSLLRRLEEIQRRFGLPPEQVAQLNTVAEEFESALRQFGLDEGRIKELSYEPDSRLTVTPQMLDGIKRRLRVDVPSTRGSSSASPDAPAPTPPIEPPPLAAHLEVTHPEPPATKSDTPPVPPIAGGRDLESGEEPELPSKPATPPAAGGQQAPPPVPVEPDTGSPSHREIERARQPRQSLATSIAEATQQSRESILVFLDPHEEAILEQAWVRRFNLQAPSYRASFQQYWSRDPEQAFANLARGYLSFHRVDSQGRVILKPEDLNLLPPLMRTELPEQVEGQALYMDSKRARTEVRLEWAWMPQLRIWVPISLTFFRGGQQLAEPSLLKTLLTQAPRPAVVRIGKNLRNWREIIRRIGPCTLCFRVPPGETVSIARLPISGSMQKGHYKFTHRKHQLAQVTIGHDGIATDCWFAGEATPIFFQQRAIQKDRQGQVTRIVDAHPVKFSAVRLKELAEQVGSFWLAGVRVEDKGRLQVGARNIGMVGSELFKHGYGVGRQYAGQPSEVLIGRFGIPTYLGVAGIPGVPDIAQWLKCVEIRTPDGTLVERSDSFYRQVHYPSLPQAFQRAAAQGNRVAVTNLHVVKRFHGSRLVSVAGHRITIPAKLAKTLPDHLSAEVIYDPITRLPVQLLVGTYPETDPLKVSELRLQPIRIYDVVPHRGKIFTATESTPTVRGTEGTGFGGPAAPGETGKTNPAR